MAATVSVSKGVFAFKSSKGKKRKDDGLPVLDHWTRDDDDDIKERTYKNYTKCWESVTKILTELQDHVHAKVFQELVDFVREAGEKMNMDRLGAVSDIPTACLVTGVNMPDHNSIFMSLVHLLTEGVTLHIARLRSRDCTTVRSAVYKMISQLMKKSDLVDPEIMEEVSGVPGLKRTQCTMPVLIAWYKELTSDGDDNSIFPKTVGSPQKIARTPKKTPASPLKAPKSPHNTLGSPRKRMATTFSEKLLGSPCTSSESQGKPSRKKIKLSTKTSTGKSHKLPLIVILEDVESFPPNVLNDLILICSEHKKDLPIVLVFGVATTSAAVHQSLSQEASACVAMEVFQAQPSTHYLNHVIEKILMSKNVLFRVGGRPFKLLLDIFLYNDLSVEKFVKGLKVCMIEHFWGNPSSFLCCKASKRASVIKNMTPSQLNVIRKLPSFRSHVEKSPPKEQTALLLDEKITKTKIGELLTSLECWYMRFCCLVKVVQTLTSTLPQCPLGRQTREVLASCLSQSIVETEEYLEATKLIKLMAREELLPLLISIMQQLQEHGEDDILSEVHYELSLLVGQLQSLDQLDEVAEDLGEEEKPVTLRASDRFNLKEKLLEMAKKKSKKTNVYDSLRSDVIQLLTTAFEKHLQPPFSQPLHEVMFLSSSSSVRRLLVGMPRPALTTALVNPHHYLQCDCCQLEDPSSIVTTLPDISVAYKLHLECGRLVNLYDWLQAFISVVGEDDDSTQKNVDQLLQARFVQAVSEMQFLGFIKPTKRKTDHVARPSPGVVVDTTASKIIGWEGPMEPAGISLRKRTT